MKILPDGTVIQSSLSPQSNINASRVYRQDYALKKGVITEIYYPEDDNNSSKEFVEYDVLVIEERFDGGVSTVPYNRCIVADKFGTPNNYEKFTLQPNTEKDDGQYKFGAQVLLLCINGNSSGSRGVIVGGISYASETKPKEDDGQFYEWQFNGINVKIDKDGQYTLTFNTPIDVEGKKLDEKAAGTKIEIFKDGKLKLSDNETQSWEIDRANQKSTWTNGAESIIIDKKNKGIELTSSGKMTSTAKEDMSLKTDKKVSIESSNDNVEVKAKDFKVESNANIDMKAGANWTMKSSANITIKAGANLMMEAGTIAQMKGTTMNMIGQGTMPIALAGISQVFGITNIPGLPIIGGVVMTGSATCFAGA